MFKECYCQCHVCVCFWHVERPWLFYFIYLKMLSLFFCEGIFLICGGGVVATAVRGHLCKRRGAPLHKWPVVVPWGAGGRIMGR